MKKRYKMEARRRNIKWWTYGFSKDFLGYNSIMLMNFKITEDDEEFKKAAANVVLTENVTEIPEPHIDGKTGNIHPGKNYIDKNGYDKFDKINMLVLSVGGVSKDGRIGVHPGPLNVNKKTTEDDAQYYYTAVHKACYFPLMSKDIQLKNDPRYKFLKDFALELSNVNKNLLSDEILKEIGKK